jgi:DNA-binding transcriptional regulator YiaG
MTKRKPMKPHEIQELLRLKDWSQVQLANELGVHESTISCWVSGTRTPLDGFSKALRRLLDEAKKPEQAKEGVSA